MDQYLVCHYNLSEKNTENKREKFITKEKNKEFFFYSFLPLL